MQQLQPTPLASKAARGTGQEEGQGSGSGRARTLGICESTLSSLATAPILDSSAVAVESMLRSGTVSTHSPSAIGSVARNPLPASPNEANSTLDEMIPCVEAHLMNSEKSDASRRKDESAKD